MHALSIGLLCAIGGYWGYRLPTHWLARFLAITLFVGIPIMGKAQIILTGGTTPADTLLAYVDTTTAQKIDPSKPWLWEVKPTERVRMMWYEEANCQGLPTPPNYFDSIRFVMVNTYAFGEFQNVRGISIMQTRFTFLAWGVAWNNGLIKHELLHYLVWNAGLGKEAMHPMPFYNRCGVTEFYQG